jgi:Protein of unknown function (DUF1769)
MRSVGGGCPDCMTIPVNNGNELPGEVLVADFESDLFEGTLLVRIRGSSGTTKEPYDDAIGYFSDVNRKYQSVVQGRFKECMPWTECLSGIRSVYAIENVLLTLLISAKKFLS